MRTQELIDFAATLADHFPNVMRAGRRLDEESLQGYWITSQARFNTWGAKLRRATDQLNATGYRGRRLWLAWDPVFAELLVSGVTTRVWASLLHSLDERLGLTEYSPIGRSVLRGHEDCRERVVNLILKGKQAENDVAERLEQLQRGIERWTDMVLAQSSRDPGLVDYCYDPDRFAHYLAVCQEGGGAIRLTVFRDALSALVGSVVVIPTHMDLHSRMHAQILSALGPELRLPAISNHSDSAWQTRIFRLTDDTQSMIQRWLDPELLTVAERAASRGQSLG